MIVVLDASAAVEVVFNRKHVQLFQEHLAEADWVISVDLFVAEVTNVFWKYHAFEDLPIDLCETSLERALKLIDNFELTIDLYSEAFALSCQINHPVYDSMYLALARRKNAIFLTMDKKLQTQAKKLSIKSLSLTQENQD